MTFASVSAALDEVNARVFFGTLRVAGYPAHGPFNHDQWTISAGGEEDWHSPVRQCWLNTSRHFEIRHGAGGDFMWWVDEVVCAAIRDKFNGRLTDEGDGRISHITEPAASSFEEYASRWRNALVRMYMWRMAKHTAPSYCRRWKECKHG